VKANRESEQLDFTTREEGSGVRLDSMTQIASNFSKPESSLEQEVMAVLQKKGLASEKDIVGQELEEGVTAEQLEERYAKLAQMKNLLFRQEMKNKRVAKIKSKLYHKIKKREKMREE